MRVDGKIPIRSNGRRAEEYRVPDREFDTPVHSISPNKKEVQCIPLP